MSLQNDIRVSFYPEPIYGIRVLNIPMKEILSVRQFGTLLNISKLLWGLRFRQFGTLLPTAVSSNFWYPRFELLVSEVRQIGTLSSNFWYFERVSKMPEKPYFIQVSKVPAEMGKYGTYCKYCSYKRRPPFQAGASVL